MKQSLKRVSTRIFPDNLYGSFAKSVGTVSGLRIAGGGLLFVSQALLAGWMGPDAFGRYSYAWAWVAVLASIGSLGLSATSVRYIAAYRAMELDSRLRGLLRFATTVTIGGSSVIALIALVVVSNLIPDSPYQGSLAIALFAIPLLSVLALESAYARGFGWMGFSVVGSQLGRPAFLIVVGLLVSLVAQTGRAEPYVMACLCAYFLAVTAQHFAVRHRISSVLDPGPRELDAASWIKMAGAVLILNVSQTVRDNVDLLITGSILPAHELGIYAAAVRTATLVAFIVSVASMVAQPTIAALHSQELPGELRRFILHATRLIFVTSLVIGAGVGLFGKLILGLFGGEFVAGYTSLIILVAGHVLAALFGPMTSLLIMTDKQIYAAVIHVLSIIFSVILNLILIPRFGIAGAATATAVTLVVTNTGLVLVARRFLNRPGSV
jgi:O-antigen/teichoic acid export membrane protein